MKNSILPFTLFVFLTLRLFSQNWEGHAAGLLPDGYQIISISVVDDKTVWVNASVASVVFGPSTVPANHLIKILRTTDGGETWHSYDVEESIGRFSFDIVGIDSLTAWLTTQDYNNGLDRALYKTEDGGNTWTLKLKHRSAGVFMRVFDSERLMCQNNSFKAWSDDGGDTWHLDTLAGYIGNEYNVVVSANNMADVVGDTVWVGTTPNGRIVRTTNYGQTTEFFETGLNNVYIQSIAFKDHLNGMLFYFASASDFGVARTSDGGVTWEKNFPQPPANYEYNLTYVPGTSGGFVTATDLYEAGSEVFWTTDFGETWTFGGSIPNTTTNSIAFSSPTSGWVASTDDLSSSSGKPLLYKWTGNAFVSSAKEAIIGEIALFPNPASDFLYLTLPENVAQPFHASLFNLSGRLVKTQTLSPGQPLELKGLAAGMYWVKAVAGGQVFTGKFCKI